MDFTESYGAVVLRPAVPGALVGVLAVGDTAGACGVLLLVLWRSVRLGTDLELSWTEKELKALCFFGPPSLPCHH